MNILSVLFTIAALSMLIPLVYGIIYCIGLLFGTLVQGFKEGRKKP